MLCAFWALDIAPTLDVLVLFFFRRHISHWSVHFLGTFLKPPKAKSGQGKRSAKGPPFIFYFFKETYKTGRAFGFFSALRLFSKIFKCPQRVPASSSLVFCNIFFRFFFGTMRHFSKENQSRICGKGVGLSLFPSDSLSFESYEQFLRKSKNDCFVGQFWLCFSHPSHTNLMKLHIKDHNMV